MPYEGDDKFGVDIYTGNFADGRKGMDVGTDSDKAQ